MSPHTDPGALLKLADELNAFFNFINEPPQYEDQRMVRDYRHELAQLWMPLHNKINAALAASQGSAGGEPIAWRYRHSSWREWKYAEEKPTGDAIHLFEVEPLFVALSPPVKTGGEAETSLYKDAIDQALVVRHLGVAAGDPVKELDTILSWEVAVALDPRVSEAAQALIDQGRYPAQEAKHCGDQSHDSRVYFMCESCEEHNPEGAVGPRSDIAVMPDGTWLCDGCYSDCDKSAYGLIASDVDDFVFPRFEDLPRPAPYGAPSVPSAAGSAQAQQVWPKEISSLVNEIAGVWDAFELGLRQEISNTNYAVVREKLSAVENLIASPVPSAQSKSPVNIGAYIDDNTEDL